MNHDLLKNIHDWLKIDNRAAYALADFDHVHLYKGSLAYDANRLLRGALKNRTKSHMALVADVITAMNAACIARTSHGVKVYRVVTGKHAATLCSSTTNVEKGFSSWTFDPNRALEFARGADATLLVATLPKGSRHLYIDGMRPAKGGDAWIYQSEIVLPPGAKTKLKARSQMAFYPGLTGTLANDDPSPFASCVKLCRLDVTVSAT